MRCVVATHNSWYSRINSVWFSSTFAESNDGAEAFASTPFDLPFSDMPVDASPFELAPQAFIH